MVEITLINPPSPFLISDKVSPPLGLLYISAYLKKYGYDPQVIDLAGGKEIGNINASIIGITSTTPQYPSVLEILHKLRSSNHEALYVIGGPHATCSPETVLHFDVSIVGEGEEAMLRIAMEPFLPFPSRFKSHPVIIDKIPFPDREAIDIHGYKYFIDDVPATTMITTRGCPYSCGFCCKINDRVRMHSAEYVISEIKEIQRLGFAGLMFFDDIFILDKQRLFKICDFLKKEKIVWRCFVRSNLVTDEIMSVMADSGCKEIGIGVESGSQKILDIVNKGTTVQQNANTIELAHKHGVRAKSFIIVGLPGESRETVKETEVFLKRTKPDDIDATVYVPFPNAPITLDPDKYDISIDYDPQKAWFKGKPGEYGCMVTTKDLTPAEIVAARDRIEQQFKRWK